MTGIVRTLDLQGDSVTAVVGPTNTGKTHRALQAVLGARSGMLGLPLRLLAREVYDRLRAEKGDDAVALVTGEEKRVPPGARYFACTVEAMPLDRATDILVVDEVQLATDRTRGHVFTDRILHARGLQHTLLLGSDTMLPLLERMVPTLRTQSALRLSSLSHAEPRKLTSLPRRSAVIGFSVDRVYDLAERLKARHGGAAVVLGALSPRARNAQVAMYQSGEVPYIVATDAIGMGLNLDVDHVAFSDTRKFDGRGFRSLTPAELAQIAGRAGRFTRDGTFSTLTETEPLDPDVIRAIETHTFDPVDEVWWRTPTPDFSSLDALLHSLQRKVPAPFYRRMRDADDHRVLVDLAANPLVRERATTPERVALLWEVAQVPDFRKTLTDSHAELLARVFMQLVGGGRLEPTWVEARVERLDTVAGDLDALMTRIAWVRTWSYLSQRRGWLEDRRGWQDRTQDIEERLSDAVHEALTRRFVERRLRLRVADLKGAVRLEDDRVIVDEELVGVVRGLAYTPMSGVKLSGPIRREVLDRVQQRANACAQAPVDAFSVAPDHGLLWEGRRIGLVEAGDDWRTPKVRASRTVELPVEVRSALAARLARIPVDAVDELLGPIRNTEGLSAPAKALLYRLEKGLLAIHRTDAEVLVKQLTKADRKALAKRDVRIGMLAVFVHSRLKPRYIAQRQWLDSVARGVRPVPQAPDAQRMSVPAAGRGRGAWLRLGYWMAGPRAIRLDIAEKVAAHVRASRRSGNGTPDGVSSLLGCPRDEVDAVLTALVPPRGKRRRRRHSGGRQG